MKKIVILFVIALALSSCTPKKFLPGGEGRHNPPGNNKSMWMTLIPGSIGIPGLWSYVDRDHNIIIYIGNEGRMTSQKLKD
jgi:hypothetical protein